MQASRVQQYQLFVCGSLQWTLFTHNTVSSIPSKEVIVTRACIYRVCTCLPTHLKFCACFHFQGSLSHRPLPMQNLGIQSAGYTARGRFQQSYVTGVAVSPLCYLAMVAFHCARKDTYLYMCLHRELSYNSITELPAGVFQAQNKLERL